jgi:hypothetical protein
MLLLTTWELGDILKNFPNFARRSGGVSFGDDT